MPAYASSIKDALATLARRNRPTDHAWFEALNRLPPAQRDNPAFLGQIGNLYLTTLHTLQLATTQLPHLTTRAWHVEHVTILATHPVIFDVYGDLFERLSDGTAWEDDRFEALDAMKKTMPLRLFEALHDLGVLYAQGLGAWVLSEHMLAEWMAALQAVLPVKEKQVVSNNHVALRLTQEIVSAKPHLDGAVLRDMQAAMQHWTVIWAVQHAMIAAENKR